MRAAEGEAATIRTRTGGPIEDQGLYVGEIAPIEVYCLTPSALFEFDQNGSLKENPVSEDDISANHHLSLEDVLFVLNSTHDLGSSN